MRTAASVAYSSYLRNLNGTDSTAVKYNDIIQQQLNRGVIELAPATKTAKEFYILYKGIERKQAKTTKLRVVYDASAKESGSQPFLNDCLHPGSPLQNLLWDVLVRSRFHSVNRRFEIGFSANQNKGRRSRFIAISLERDWERCCNTNVPIYPSPVWAIEL